MKRVKRAAAAVREDLALWLRIMLRGTARRLPWWAHRSWLLTADERALRRYRLAVIMMTAGAASWLALIIIFPLLYRLAHLHREPFSWDVKNPLAELGTELGLYVFTYLSFLRWRRLRKGRKTREAEVTKAMADFEQDAEDSLKRWSSS